MLRRISGNFGAQIASLALTLADRIVLIGILLRVWGTDVYSDWAVLFASAGLLSLGELGLGVYFGNSWQNALARNDKTRFENLIGISLFTYFVLGAALAAAAIIFALTADLRDLFHVRVLTSQEVLLVFLVLAGTNVMRVMRGSISQIYRGRGQFAAGILISAISTAATIIMASCAALAGASVVVVAFMYLFAEVVAGWVVMAADLVRRYPDLSVRITVPTSRDIAGITSKVSWYSLLQGAPIVWLQVPVLMLGALGLVGSSLVSFLLARTLVNFARQLSTMLSLSVGVETAGAFHLGDTSNLARRLSAFGEFLSGLSGASAGGLLVFGAPIIHFWTGKTELINPTLLFWLLFPTLFVTPALPLSTILTLGNTPRPAGIASLLQIMLGLVLCYVFALRFGIVGAAAGLGIGEAVAMGVLLPTIGSRRAGLSYRRYLLRCTVTFLLSVVWCGGVATVLAALAGVVRLELLALSVALWALFGFAPAVYLAMPTRQRRSLTGVFRNWGLSKE